VQVPPFEAETRMDRVRKLWPAPQVAEQADQALHSDNWQSDGQGLLQGLVWVNSTFVEQGEQEDGDEVEEQAVLVLVMTPVPHEPLSNSQALQAEKAEMTQVASVGHCELMMLEIVEVCLQTGTSPSTTDQAQPTTAPLGERTEPKQLLQARSVQGSAQSSTLQGWYSILWMVLSH
jgi:hypothetical protein